MGTAPLTFTLLPERFTVCRLDPAAPVPAWAGVGPFVSTTLARAGINTDYVLVRNDDLGRAIAGLEKDGCRIGR